MAKQLLNISEVTIDLDMIVYVSDAGHIDLNAAQSYHSVPKHEVKTVVEAWGEWKAYKFAKTLEAMRG